MSVHVSLALSMLFPKKIWQVLPFPYMCIVTPATNGSLPQSDASLLYIPPGINHVDCRYRNPMQLGLPRDVQLRNGAVVSGLCCNTRMAVKIPSSTS